MKNLFIFTLLTIAINLTAQTDTSFISTVISNNIYAMDLKASTQKMEAFLDDNNIVIQSKTESKTNLDLTISLTPAQFEKYQQLRPELGYLSYDKISSENNNAKVSEINLELKYLKQKRDSYVEFINRVDANSDKYLTLWNEQKQIEEQIFTKEKELLAQKVEQNNYILTLSIDQESTSPESSGVDFVNMPGVEYSFLSIEAPQAGISASNYQGYFLKYLFTRGKTFATIGVYKGSELALTDTTGFSEMFTFGFGQDFYSRHLGHGSRKFLNLYSGYTVGALLATGVTSKETNFYIQPSIGIEIFKTRYLLWDSKVNYFVPFIDNKNLRGVSFNTSLNFVF